MTRQNLATILPLMAFSWPSAGCGRATVSSEPLPTQHRPDPGQFEPSIRSPLASGHKVGVVETLAFSPDGKILAAGNGRAEITLYEATTARTLVTLPSLWRSGAINLLTYAPDGRSLAANHYNREGDFSLLEPGTGRVRLTLNWSDRPPKATGAWPHSLAYAPDGKSVAAGYSSGEVVIWDAQTGRQRVVTPPHTLPERYVEQSKRVWPSVPADVQYLAFSPSGTSLVSGSLLRFWDVATGKERPSPIAQKFGYNSRYTPDGMLLTEVRLPTVPGVQRSEIALWDLTTGEKRAVTPTFDHLQGFEILPDGLMLVTLDRNLVRLWDLETGTEVASVAFERHCFAEKLAVSPDGRWIAAGGYESDLLFGMIFLIETDGRTLRPLKPGVMPTSTEPPAKPFNNAAHPGGDAPRAGPPDH